LLERKANDPKFQARAQRNRNLLRLSVRFREVFVCAMEAVLLVSALARAPYCLYSWLCSRIVTVHGMVTTDVLCAIRAGDGACWPGKASAESPRQPGVGVPVLVE